MADTQDPADEQHMANTQDLTDAQNSANTQDLADAQNGKTAPEVQSGAAAENSSDSRRHRIVKALFLCAISFSLPLTILLLWLLAYLHMWPRDVDITGLLAISIGILGILIFFIFLYKYQILAIRAFRRRWIMLGMHAIVVIAFFLFTIWLGFDSPWKSTLIWGSYDMLSAAKPWIISVLVFGSITFLGSLFDLIRKRFEQRWRDAEGR
ncbi:MAG: hypothetical protein WC824_07325 [Bacteroidota bacterium]|jgi:hypothetical protein